MRAVGGAFLNVEPWFCLDDQRPAVIDSRTAYADESHVSAQYVTDIEPLLATS